MLSKMQKKCVFASKDDVLTKLGKNGKKAVQANKFAARLGRRYIYRSFGENVTFIYKIIL